MMIFVFFLRTIALTVALTACSSVNEAVVFKDIQLIEEVTEDIIEISECEEAPSLLKEDEVVPFKKKKKYPSSSCFKRN